VTWVSRGSCDGEPEIRSRGRPALRTRRWPANQVASDAGRSGAMSLSAASEGPPAPEVPSESIRQAAAGDRLSGEVDDRTTAMGRDLRGSSTARTPVVPFPRGGLRAPGSVPDTLPCCPWRPPGARFRHGRERGSDWNQLEDPQRQESASLTPMKLVPTMAGRGFTTIKVHTEFDRRAHYGQGDQLTRRVQPQAPRSRRRISVGTCREATSVRDATFGRRPSQPLCARSERVWALAPPDDRLGRLVTPW
jgi:hypothetical protein